MTDDVNNPQHYMLFPDREVIELMRHELTNAEFRGYLKGNILKYRMRAGKKDDLEKDIKKALWYERELWETFNTPKLHEMCQDILTSSVDVEV